MDSWIVPDVPHLFAGAYCMVCNLHYSRPDHGLVEDFLSNHLHPKEGTPE